MFTKETEIILSEVMNFDRKRVGEKVRFGNFKDTRNGTLPAGIVDNGLLAGKNTEPAIVEGRLSVTLNVSTSASGTAAELVN